MADQTLDPRLELLLRESLKAEAASLPLQVGPDQILERARARQGAGGGLRLRRSFLGQLSSGPRFVSMAVAAVAVFAVAAVLLSNLPRSIEGPAAPLPTSPADWTRVIVDPEEHSGIIRIAAGPRGLIAVARSVDDGQIVDRIHFSADGRVWAEAAVSPRGGDVSVVATEHGFLMISSDGEAWTSANGLEWQHVAGNWAGGPGALVIDAVAGGPGYVAVGSHNKIWYSTDGSDWALADVPPPPADLINLTVDIEQVAAVGENLVATGFYSGENSDAAGIARDFVLASSDGRTWSTVLPDVGDHAARLNLAAGPDGFLMIGGPLAAASRVDGQDASTIWRSADGSEWQRVASYDFSSGSTNEDPAGAVAATSSGYVAVTLERACSGCPPPALVWTSPDGRSWLELAGGDPFVPERSGVDTITADGSRFLVGGSHDDRPAIWISGPRGPEATPDATVAPEPTGAGPELTASPSPTLAATARPTPTATTENGQPIVLSYASEDGEVTVSAPSTWSAWLPGKAGHQASDVWFGMLQRNSDPWPNYSHDHIGFVDPVAYDSWCATHGGSPLLSAPASAAVIAQEVIADPNFETTAPVAARVGGVEAVSIDVALAPGGRACGIQTIAISRWIHSLQPGLRLRLYLVDLPEGMSVETLAITVLAPEDSFAEVIAETAPIIESIEFHPR